MAQVITLTTDFGVKDGYVAAMKGAILDINPEVALVDISHDIAPQNVRETAFILGTAYRYFPEGTIHLIVVDPGVGTGRRGLAVGGSGCYFVAPDNGVLSHVLADAMEGNVGGSCRSIQPQPLPTGFRAISLNNSEYWRPELSCTFHGRDIFAPVAAHLSTGVSLEDLGDPVTSVMAFSRPTPTRADDGSLLGEIIHIDSFGNLITNLRVEDLPGDQVEVEIAGQKISGISSSYQEHEGLLAIGGSSGYLEIGESNGNAAKRTGSTVGAQVAVRVASG